MTTNDIRKASLWHVLWSLYRTSFSRRLTPGQRLSTGAVASWCVRPFAFTCAWEGVQRTSRIDPSSRGPYSCKTRCGVATKGPGTADRRSCERCGTGFIELSIPGRSPRHLRRGQVVYPRGGFGESREPKAGSWTSRTPTTRARHLANGADERATVFPPGIRRRDTTSPPAVLRPRYLHHSVQFRYSDLFRAPQLGARSRRDSYFLALAQALDIPLITADRRMLSRLTTEDGALSPESI